MEAGLPGVQKNNGLLDYGLSCEVLIHFLGFPWVKEQILERKNTYFDPGSIEDVGNHRGHLHEHRVTTLGRRLFELQDVPGFDAMVRRLHGVALSGAYAEVLAVALLRLGGQSVRFVEPVGVRTQDFDAAIIGNGHEIAVEVKARDEETLAAYRDVSVLNSLNKARKQVPRQGPALVFVQICSSWAGDMATRASIDASVRSWMRGVSRVNAVVLMFEQFVPHGEAGVVVIVGFDVIANPSPRTDVPNIMGVLRGLELSLDLN